MSLIFSTLILDNLPETKLVLLTHGYLSLVTVVTLTDIRTQPPMTIFSPPILYYTDIVWHDTWLICVGFFPPLFSFHMSEIWQIYKQNLSYNCVPSFDLLVFPPSHAQWCYTLQYIKNCSSTFFSFLTSHSSRNKRFLFCPYKGAARSSHHYIFYSSHCNS